jgi:site-specific DNA-methyltransferase (adenine-specific)/modification methylase
VPVSESLFSSLRAEPRYADAWTTLYHGRCEDILGQLAPSSVGLVVADLPYGSTRNDWDKEIDPKLLWHYFHEVCTERSAQVLFGSGLFSAKTIMSNPAEYRFSLVWDKQAISGHLNAKRQPLRAHEDIHVFYRAQPPYHPQMVAGRRAHSRGRSVERTTNHWGAHVNTPARDSDLQYPRSILRFPRPKEGLHPSQKPVDLLAWLIRTWSDPGAVVLDATCGSGSTLVAARAEGRFSIGIEADERYCEVAARRLASAADPGVPAS